MEGDLGQEVMDPADFRGAQVYGFTTSAHDCYD